MALVPKIDPNKIFASNAPTQDKPAAFDNYEKGMDETRKNLGRPTIPQLNYLHQTADQKILWIHQNGAGLPYDASIEYAEKSVTLKDGELKQFVDGAWVEVKTKALPATAITTASAQNQQQINDFGGAKWYAKVGGYELGATVKLANGDTVQSIKSANIANPNVDMTGWKKPTVDKDYVDETYVSKVASAAADGVIPFLTQAELLLAKPTQAKVLAKAMDSRKEYLWNRTSAEGVTPVTGAWTDTGLSDLDQAKTYANANGLFNPKSLPINSDFNSLEDGYFIVQANVSTMLNMPVQSNGIGHQTTDSNGNKTQEYSTFPLNRKFFRSKWNGVWTAAWKEVADTAATIPTTTQKTGAQTLSTYTAQGIYDFLGASVISDLPSDAQSGVGYTLKVEDYISGGVFKMQILKCTSGTKAGQMWERTLNATTGVAGAWRFYSKLHDAEIFGNNLSQSFRFKNTIANATMSDYRDDGLYTFTTPTDAPTNALSTTGLVENKNFNLGAFVIQTWRSLTDLNDIYTRRLRPTEILPWVKVGGTASNNPYADKKIVCFGDSITEFGTYPAQLASRLGATGYNVGFGGTRLGEHTDQWYAPFSMYNVAQYIANDDLATLSVKAVELNARYSDNNTAIVTRLQSIDFTTVDYVTIFFGTNDWFGNVPMGTNSDTSGVTFKGAINATVNSLQTKYPNLKMLLVTPYWRSRKSVADDGLESDTTPNDIGLYMLDYVDALKEVAALNKLPVLDLYRNSSINKYTKSVYISADGLHPNATGYTHLANLIAAKLSSTY